MNELSLFSGAGGGVLGTALLGFRHVGYVESDPKRQRILARRIADGHLERAPIFGDVVEFVESGAAEQYRGIADVVTGGFPCRPFSTAARGRNNAINLWPAMLRVVRAVRPRFVFAENVAGSRRVWDTVRSDLQGVGYTVRGPLALGSSDVGGPDIGKRFWLLAEAHQDGEPVRAEHGEASRLPTPTAPCGCAWWRSAPAVGVGVADGVASRLDRLGAIGDGQVPAVVVRAWRELSG